MGNNEAFTAFEATAIAVYNRGILDKDLLSELMKPYGGVDIDSGGMAGTLANDGKDIIEIVLTVFGEPVPVRPKLPENYREWTPEQDAANEEYQESLWGKFNKITDQFGWS